MQDEYFPFVIVGHVDHGKSTLIGRLLFDTNSLPEGKVEEIKKTCEMLGKPFEFAKILDTLEEERKQGITIDTTQTFFKTDKRNYVIIDAPGHKEFLKNMITGSSQAEAAILVVDVNEGVSEQTRRHAFILSFLGIKQIIAVLNKMDLVNWNKERYEKVKDDLTEFLAKIGVKPMVIIPISAMEGDNVVNKSNNMGWYNGPTVVESLNSFTWRTYNPNGPLRFPVQDVYKFDSKRIVVGRVESGKIEEGDHIVVLPGGEKTYVKSIEVFHSPKDGSAGRSIGITTKDPLFIDRGNVISKVGEKQPIIANKITVSLFWMADKRLDIGNSVNVRCSTQESTGILKSIKDRIDSSTLDKKEPTHVDKNDVAVVEIELDKPIVIDDISTTPELGRIVIEENGIIIGAGIIKI